MPTPNNILSQYSNTYKLAAALIKTFPQYKKYKPEQFIDMMQQIALSETGDKNISQMNGGPGRGYFQVETPRSKDDQNVAAITAYNRAKNTLEELKKHGSKENLVLPKYDKDFTKLDKDSQAFYALSNMLGNAQQARRTNPKAYVDPTNPGDSWREYHWVGNRKAKDYEEVKKERMAHWKEATLDYKPILIEGFTPTTQTPSTTIPTTAPKVTNGTLTNTFRGGWLDKFEEGGSINDQKIPTPTSPSFYPAFPDRTLTNYQMGTPKAPMYAAGATVWTKQNTPTWVAGTPTPTATQHFRNDRSLNTEHYRIGDIVPTGMNYKTPAAGTHDYNQDVQPYHTMRLHAPDTTKFANGGKVQIGGESELKPAARNTTATRLTPMTGYSKDKYYGPTKGQALLNDIGVGLTPVLGDVVDVYQAIKAVKDNDPLGVILNSVGAVLPVVSGQSLETGVQLLGDEITKKFVNEKYGNGGSVKPQVVPLERDVPKQNLPKDPVLGLSTDPYIRKYSAIKKDESFGKPYEFLMNWYNDPVIKKRLKDQNAPENPMKEALNQKLFKNYLGLEFHLRDENKKSATSVYDKPEQYKERKDLIDELDKLTEVKMSNLYKTTAGVHMPSYKTIGLNGDRSSLSNLDNTATHEITHATPLDDFYVSYFKNHPPKNPDPSHDIYFKEVPEEIYPRIQDLRYQMWKDNIITPSKKITPDMLKNYNNGGDYDLKKYYSDEELSKIMNEIADNSTQETKNKMIQKAKKGGRVLGLYEMMGMPTPSMYGPGGFTGNSYNRFNHKKRNTGDDSITGFTTGFTNNFTLPQGYSSTGQSSNINQATTPNIGVRTNVTGLDYTKDLYNDNNVALSAGLSLGKGTQSRGSLFKSFNYTTPYGTPGTGFSHVQDPESKDFMVGSLHGNADAHIPLLSSSWKAQKQGHRNIGAGGLELLSLNPSLEVGLDKFGHSKINPYYDANVGVGMLNNIFNVNAGYTNKKGNLEVGLPNGTTSIDPQTGRPYVDMGFQVPVIIDNKGNTRFKVFGGYGVRKGDNSGYAGATYTFADGGHITHYIPSYNFGHVQSANNTYRHGYANGGKVNKYGFGGYLKDSGKLLTNTLAAPLEQVSGNNFVNFNYENKGMADAAAVSEGVLGAGTDVAGSLLLGPAYGMAKGAIQPMTSQIGHSQEYQRGADKWANTTGQISSSVGNLTAGIVSGNPQQIVGGSGQVLGSLGKEFNVKELGMLGQSAGAASQFVGSGGGGSGETTAGAGDMVGTSNVGGGGMAAMGGYVNGPNLLKFAEGGSPDVTMGNVEKGELLLDSTGRIVTKYRGGGMVPHPADGSQDPNGNVPLQEGQFIIPVSFAKKYEGSMKNNDKLYADSIKNTVVINKAKKEAAQQAAELAMQEKASKAYGRFMAKYGGYVPKYDEGAGVDPWYATPSMLSANNDYSNATPNMPSPFGMPQVNSSSSSNGFITPMPTLGLSMPYTGPMSNTAEPSRGFEENMQTQDSSFNPLGHISNLTNTKFLSDFEELGRPNYPTGKGPLNTNKDTNNTQGVGNILDKVLTYGPGLYNLGRGIFEKPFNMNAADYQVQGRMKPYDEQYRPDYAPYNAAMYNLKNLPGSANLAARTNLYNAGAKNFADEKYRVNQGNLARKMSSDQANLGIEAANKNIAMQIAQFNEQNKAAKRNMLGQGISDLSQATQFEKTNKTYGNVLKDLYANYDWVNGKWTPKKSG